MYNQGLDLMGELDSGNVRQRPWERMIGLISMKMNNVQDGFNLNIPGIRNPFSAKNIHMGTNSMKTTYS